MHILLSEWIKQILTIKCTRQRVKKLYRHINKSIVNDVMNYHKKLNNSINKAIRGLITKSCKVSIFSRNSIASYIMTYDLFVTDRINNFLDDMLIISNNIDLIKNNVKIKDKYGITKLLLNAFNKYLIKILYVVPNSIINSLQVLDLQTFISKIFIDINIIIDKYKKRLIKVCEQLCTQYVDLIMNKNVKVINNIMTTNYNNFITKFKKRYKTRNDLGNNLNITNLGDIRQTKQDTILVTTLNILFFQFLLGNIDIVYKTGNTMLLNNVAATCIDYYVLFCTKWYNMINNNNYNNGKIIFEYEIALINDTTKSLELFYEFLTIIKKKYQVDITNIIITNEPKINGIVDALKIINGSCVNVLANAIISDMEPIMNQQYILKENFTDYICDTVDDYFDNDIKNMLVPQYKINLRQTIYCKLIDKIICILHNNDTCIIYSHINKLNTYFSKYICNDEFIIKFTMDKIKDIDKDITSI